MGFTISNMSLYMGLSKTSDIAFYGTNLNQSVILAELGYGKGPT